MTQYLVKMDGKLVGKPLTTENKAKSNLKKLMAQYPKSEITISTQTQIYSSTEASMDMKVDNMANLIRDVIPSLVEKHFFSLELAPMLKKLESAIKKGDQSKAKEILESFKAKKKIKISVNKNHALALKNACIREFKVAVKISEDFDFLQMITGDVRSFVELAHLLVEGKMTKVYSKCRDLDTSVREAIPDRVWDFMNNDDDDWD